MPRRAALALALVALAGLALLAAAGGPGDLARRAVRVALEAAGLPVRALGEASLGRSGVELRDLAVGAADASFPDLEIRRLRLEPSLRGLLRGDLGRLSVEGLRIRGRIDASGAHFGSLDAFLPGGGGEGGSGAAFALALRVRDGELLLETPVHPLAVRFRTEVRRDREGALRGRVEVSAEHTFGRAAGAAEAVLDAAGGLRVIGVLRGPGGTVAGLEVRRPPEAEAVGTGPGAGAPPQAFASLRLRFDGGDLPGAIAGAVGLSELRLGPGWVHLRAAEVPTGRARISAAAAVSVSRARLPSGPALAEVDLGASGALAVGGDPAAPEAAAGKGAFRLGLAVHRITAGAVELRRARVEAHLDASAPQGGGLPLTLRLAEPARLSAGSVRVAAGPRTTRPLALRVRPGAGPLLLLERAPGEGPRWTSTWRVEAAELEVDPGGALAGATGRLRGRLPALEGELAGRAGGGLPRGRVRGSGGRLAAEAAGVRAEEIGLKVELPEERDVLRARITAARIRDLRRPARFGPTSAGLRLRVDAASLDRVGFAARVEGRGHPLRIEVRGEHRLRTGHGHASVAVGPVRFRDDGPGPAAILPALAPVVDRARGEVEARAELRWPDRSGVAGAGQVRIANLRLAGPVGEVEGLAGRVVLASVLPPATPPGQELAAEAASVGGLRLLAPRLRFELRPDRRLVLEAFRAGLAGGRLASSGTVDPDSEAPGLVLNVQEVDLAQLLRELGTDAVEVTGTVIGALPLVLRDGELRIEGGELHALPPGGVLRYRVGQGVGPLEGPASGTELARAALENLHYESLRITLDGALAGELRIHLDVLGRNPDVYGGAAFKVGLNLSGRLLDLIHAGTTGYRVRDQIERRIEAR